MVSKINYFQLALDSVGDQQCPSFLVSSSQFSERSVMFKITKVPPLHWKEIAQMAAEWSDLAQVKYEAIHGGSIPCHRSFDDYDCDPGVLFLSSQSMNQEISYQLQKLSKKRLWDHTLICQDETEAVQAIALYDAKSHRLSHLATHPDNIRHDVNKDVAHRVQGAGTQIVLYLAEVALKTNKTLRLIATQESIPFYQKLHFEKDLQNLDGREAYHGKSPMKLTVKKIRQLAKERISPFDQLTALVASIPVCPSRTFDLDPVSSLEQLERLFPPSSLDEDEKIALGVRSLERFGVDSFAYFERVYRFKRSETSFVSRERERRQVKRDHLKIINLLSETSVSGISSHSIGLHGDETQARHYLGPIEPRKIISDYSYQGANGFIECGKAYSQLGKGVFVVSQFLTDEEKRDDNCLKYALLAHQAPLKKHFQVSVSMMPSILDSTYFNGIVRRCFVSISPSSDVLRSGDLAVYEHEQEVVHAGIYREETIESKWGFRGSDYVFEHSVFLVPDVYGNTVKFYRLNPTTSEHV